MTCKPGIFALFLLSLLLAEKTLSASEITWTLLEKKAAVLDQVIIDVQDVFNLEDPKENHWLGQTANLLHIKTRRKVIRQNLLFSEGDRVNARVIEETERLLRSLPYLIDARIIPQITPDGRVTARVNVEDAWSIRVGARFSNVGGDQDWRIGIGDVNLLGYGKELFLSRGKDLERTTEEVFYTDPLLFGSRWSLETAYQDLSDGDLKAFRLEKAFFEYATPWSAGAAFRDESKIHTLYDRDREIFTFPFSPKEISLYARRLLRFHNRTALRAGLEYRFIRKEYGGLNQVSTATLPPPDLESRTYSGILGYFALNQDRYGSFRNLQAVSVTENYNLGWDLELSGGVFSDAMGGDTNAVYLEATADKGLQPGPGSLFLMRAGGHGFKESKGFRDVLGSLQLTYYKQAFPFQTLAANLDLTGGYEMDPEHLVYLGGEDGLRGYPTHFRAGDVRWVLTLEDRVILPLNLWGLVQVGFVGFLEAGAIHDMDGGGWSKVYADAGGGLRFGNLKSAFGRVILITLAVPLVKEDETEGYEFLVGNEVRF